MERVVAEATARKALAVHRVSVRVGALAGVEPDLLATAFEMCREGTVCAAALLDVVRVPAEWVCASCGLAVPEADELVCASCGGAGTARCGGRADARSDRDGGALMCDSCGCGDKELVAVEVHERILAGNDAAARHNREHFQERGVLAVNLMGSPGAGKTALLEATARHFAGQRRLGAVAGDLETHNDAERLRAAGIPSTAITTGSACHLDAKMVHHALHHFPWSELDYLFVENVGNLVCPAVYDLGRGRERRGPLGDRRGGQAAQVPGDVPQGGSRRGDEDGSSAASRFLHGAPPGESRTGDAAAVAFSSSRRGRGRGWGNGWLGSRKRRRPKCSGPGTRVLRRRDGSGRRAPARDGDGF